MKGIDLEKPIFYQNASLRFFDKNEKHITRICETDVLLLVFDGTLRFSEDDKKYEVVPGMYHIQRQGTYQTGYDVSDSPKYLFVHFKGIWTENEKNLPFQGSFEYKKLKSLMEDLDKMSHENYIYIEQCAKFFELLSILYNRGKNEQTITEADNIANFIKENYLNNISLETICKKFHFSKNHVINIFKEKYKKTPVEYINELKIKRTEYLLEVTSDKVDNIAYRSGFNNYSHFYRLFFRKNNLSPTEWRDKKRHDFKI